MIRLLSAPTLVRATDFDVDLEVDGRIVRWRVVVSGTAFRHTVWVDKTGDSDEPFLVERCGFERITQALQAQLGGEPWAWDLVGDMLWSSRVEYRLWQMEVDEARAAGWKEASDTMRRAAVKRDRAESPPRRSAPCRLYLMHRDGMLKIGVSSKPSRRAKDLRTASATAVTVLASMQFGSRRSALLKEREVHAIFAAHRIGGEWFRDVPEIRDHFRVNGNSVGA